MELQLFAIFVLFSLFPQYLSYATHFFHLAGYKILADPLNGPQFFENSTLCAAECAFGFDRICVGYRYINGECQLYMNIRNIVMHSKSCGYRVIDRRDEQKDHPIMATLNKTDQLVFAVLYEASTCPDGFTVNISSCSVPMLESECKEYSKFVNATFDGSECAFPANRSQWYCAPQNNPHQKMLFVTPTNVGYCYFKTNATVPATVASFNQQCKSASSKSSMVTICSNAENDYIASISTEWPTYLSLYTPAAAPTKGVYNWSDSSNVGRYCIYRKWKAPNTSQTFEDQPSNYVNNSQTIVGMADDRYWYDVPVASINSDEALICKEKAYTLEEYITQCQSLDNCAQLNLSKAKDEL